MKYLPDKQQYIIDIMLKFELCYEIDDQNILITQRLYFQELKIEFSDADSIEFYVAYDFLQKYVMPYFIVKLQKETKESLYGRTGLPWKAKV